jgi:hypothetical protein
MEEHHSGKWKGESLNSANQQTQSNQDFKGVIKMLVQVLEPGGMYTATPCLQLLKH